MTTNWPVEFLVDPIRELYKLHDSILTDPNSCDFHHS